MIRRACPTGLHRSSVVRAYNELRALGYLESLAGSYTTVRRRERPPTARSAAADIANESLIDWQVATRPTVRALRNHAAMEPARAIESSDLIDLDRLCLVDGQSYWLSLWVAQRTAPQASVRMETNILFTGSDLPSITAAFD